MTPRHLIQCSDAWFDPNESGFVSLRIAIAETADVPRDFWVPLIAPTEGLALGFRTIGIIKQHRVFEVCAAQSVLRAGEFPLLLPFGPFRKRLVG